MPTSTTLDQELSRLAASLKNRLEQVPARSQPIPITPAPDLCIPNCPICAGQGWLRREAKPGDSAFGILDPCPNIFKAITAAGDDRFGLDAAEMQGLGWDSIKLGLSAGYDALDAVRVATRKGHGMVFLWGDYGQAKTMLLKIAIAESLRAGTQAVYANLTDILDHVRAAYDEEQNAMNELTGRIDYWSGLPVLAIDELDKANETKWARERIHQLLDRRYQMAVRQTGLTLIASNKSTGQLDGYLASRLEDRRFEGSVIHLSGPDGRKSVPEGYPW